MDFDLVGGQLHNGEYHDGDAAQGILPSFDTALWMNAVAKSFRNIIIAGGLTPDIDDPTLTLQAILALTAAQIDLFFPVGSLVPSYSPAPPSANLFKPNGAELSRAAYPELWNFANSNGLVGAGDDFAFGPGDGSTTFTIPNDDGLTYFQWDSSGLIDPGRPFGSYRPDLVLDHTHGLSKTLEDTWGDWYADRPTGVGDGPFTTGPVNSGNSGSQNKVKDRAINIYLRAF